MNRRTFTRYCGLPFAIPAAGTGLLSLLQSQHLLGEAPIAVPANFNDYKALVCIFLFGGNDSYGAFLPSNLTNPPGGHSYSKFLNGRNNLIESTLGYLNPMSLPKTNGFWALHPGMWPLIDLLNARKLSIVGNVGPIYRQGVFADAKPRRLGSHDDQIAAWQNGFPRERLTSSGWLGRLQQAIPALTSAPTYEAISLSGFAEALGGEQSAQRSSVISPQNAGNLALASFVADVAGPTGLDDLKGALVAASQGTPLAEGYGGSVQRMFESVKKLKTLLTSFEGLRENDSDITSPLLDKLLRDKFFNGTNAIDDGSGVWKSLRTPLTSGDDSNERAKKARGPARDALAQIEQQLYVACKMMVLAKRNVSIAGISHPKRQIFFVGLGGFDTHGSNNDYHLMALAYALREFQWALETCGIAENVVTFTASDFGRTWDSNGYGTDHGWGGTHLVMHKQATSTSSPALIGEIPDPLTDLSGNLPGESRILAEDRGIWHPQYATDQYYGSIMKWFGTGTVVGDSAHLHRFTDAQYQRVLPNAYEPDTTTPDPHDCKLKEKFFDPPLPSPTRPGIAALEARLDVGV